MVTAAGAKRPPVMSMIIGALLLGGAGALALAFGTRVGLLMLIGGLLGVTLYHASFGFSSAWRAFISEGRGRGLRAQMVMLAIAVVLFSPALEAGSLWGQSLRGSVSPVGVSLLAGAFLFGVGMQVGGGCASGTLFTVGGGNARMVVTLLFFIVGSVIGTAHFAWWTGLPSLEPVSFVQTFGAQGGIAVSLALMGAIAAFTVFIEKRRHGALEKPPPANLRERWLTGPWPLLLGAVALALLNFATLAIAGRPWGVTSAFALWGAKAYEFLGGDVSQWGYWLKPSKAESLRASVWSGAGTVMNVGIVLGAMGAATLAGRFAPSLRIPLRPLLAAVIGGLMMGYGARLAFGCNVGAYFGGIASGSLHGWAWMMAGFAGSILGTALRPHFYDRPPG